MNNITILTAKFTLLVYSMQLLFRILFKFFEYKYSWSIGWKEIGNLKGKLEKESLS
jgi:hypothetical protein